MNQSENEPSAEDRHRARENPRGKLPLVSLS